MYGNKDSDEIFPFDVRMRYKYLVYHEALGQTEDGQVFSKKSTRRYSFFSPTQWDTNLAPKGKKSWFELQGKSYTILHDPIEQAKLEAELKANPGDWELQGSDKGKAVVIRRDAESDYLRWIRKEILDGYADKIARRGGIDLHVIGVGGRGHVGFHEAGVPFQDNQVILIKLDDDTISNAVTDGHFSSKEESPLYAVSMGAELIYRAKTVLLLANGKRKADAVADALLMEPDGADFNNATP